MNPPLPPDDDDDDYDNVPVAPTAVVVAEDIEMEDAAAEGDEGRDLSSRRLGNRRSRRHGGPSPHSEDRLWGAVEIIPGRLYYAPLRFFPREDDDDDDDDDDDENDDDDDEEADDSDSDDEERPSSSSSAAVVVVGGESAERRRATTTTTASTKKEHRNPIHYFSMDDELVYWNFFLDFGPLNLGQLYRFCHRVNTKLSSTALRDHVLCYYSGQRGSQRANASFLICAWSMIYLGRTAEEAYRGFEEGEGSDVEVDEGGGGGGVATDRDDGMTFVPGRGRQGRKVRPPNNSGRRRRRRQLLRPSPFVSLHPLPPYHDASPVACTYDLSVRDCLDGLDRARRLGFFRFGNAPPSPPMTGLRPVPPASPPSSKVVATMTTTNDDEVGGGGGSPVFDVDEYEHFEQVENGDLNWIVSGRILAFAGPHSHRSTTSDGYCVLTPDEYIPYFRRRGVKLVIQLNKGCYDGDRFVRAGMRHVVHQYPDGSCPEPGVLRGVLSDMEEVGLDGGAFAVHCKAGLGRTGTCVGAYIMKHYRFTAREVIGYMRICRPGMVIGPQQHFLEDIERLMWQEGDVHLGRGLRGVVGGGGGEREEGGHGTATTTKEAAVAAATSTANAVTPRATTVDRVGGGVPGGGGVGSHISIVTPDGRPFLLPATPVVARRPRVEDTPSPSSFALPSATTSSTSPAMDTLSGANRSSIVVGVGGGDEGLAAKAGKTNTPNDDVDDDEDMQEGDQANALLSRRLDQYQARHQQHAKK